MAWDPTVFRAHFVGWHQAAIDRHSLMRVFSRDQVNGLQMEWVPYSERQSPNKIWLLLRDRGDSTIATFLNRLDDRTLTATAQLFDRTEASGPPRNIERFRHDEHERSRP